MFDKIAKLLAEQLGIPQSKITLESKIVEDLGADSLDVVELLMCRGYRAPASTIRLLCRS